MGTLQKPIMLDDTGKRIADAIEQMAVNNLNAAESAARAETYLKDLEEAIEQLPDGQAVSAKVAEHTVDLSKLYKRGVISQNIKETTDEYSISGQVYGVIPQAHIELLYKHGIEFNDTDSPIEITAPWGENVQHLPGYFYLNGLGDISYKEALNIYIISAKIRSALNINPLFTEGFFEANLPRIRTNIIPCTLDRRVKDFYVGRQNGSKTAYELNIYETCTCHVLNFGLGTYNDNIEDVQNLPNYKLKRVYGNGNLIHVCYPINVSEMTSISSTIFMYCSKLRTLKLYGLKMSLSLSHLKKISNDSILYTIRNSNATTNITLTLYKDVYDRAMADSNIVAALESKPLVNLAYV